MVEIRFEPLSYLLLNGLPDLAFECWQELEHEHPDVPYNPDWQQYERMEKNDNLRFVSLREDEKLIGYASIVLEEERHRKGVLVGYFNDIFITRAKRGHAARMVNFIERHLSDVGVRRLVAAERLTVPDLNKAGDFYELMGFRPSQMVWSKTLN